jgi:uncharacterized RDD family membrane protein YckC
VARIASAPGQQLYARAAPRLQAWLRDFLVQLAIVVTCITTAVLLGTDMAVQAIIITCVATLVLYEPVCIALAGGTIGHVTMDLRVARASDLGRVSFGRALLRTIVKALFGLWVFMAVYFTRRSQALHDLAAGTVVVPRDAAATAPRQGFAIERA